VTHIKRQKFIISWIQVRWYNTRARPLSQYCYRLYVTNEYGCYTRQFFLHLYFIFSPNVVLFVSSHWFANSLTVSSSVYGPKRACDLCLSFLSARQIASHRITPIAAELQRQHRLSKWRPFIVIVAGFGFDDIAHVRKLISIRKPNFDEIPAWIYGWCNFRILTNDRQIEM